MDRRKEQTTLMDRHNKCVADILKHFMGLCAAATQPIDDHYTTEVAVLNSMKMENESSALIKQVENLLQLSREMKTLWVTGPLITNSSDEVKALEAQIDAKTEAVCAMFNQWMAMRSRNVKEAALARAVQANQNFS